MTQFQELANLASSYKQQYETGQLSAKDFKELIEDLNIADHIQSEAAQLEQDQYYQLVLVNALDLAASLPV
jgi:hypothetical protein|tara:strand:- start:246 stop:458 length:213 start_codon:yes stop_codon:yes gene_type:complete